MTKLENRLKFLKNKHKKQHDIIEALEAEKAPEEIIKNHKRLKLSLKDEITELESEIKGLQNVG
jgi:hypothetical protein